MNSVQNSIFHVTVIINQFAYDSVWPFAHISDRHVCYCGSFLQITMIDDFEYNMTVFIMIMVGHYAHISDRPFCSYNGWSVCKLKR